MKKILFLFILLCFPLVSFVEGNTLPEGDTLPDNDATESVPQFARRKKIKKDKSERNKKPIKRHESDVDWNKVDAHYLLDRFLGPSAESKRIDKAIKWKKSNQKLKQRNEKHITNQSHRKMKREFSDIPESDPLFEQIIACAKKHNKKGKKYGKKYGRRVALGDFENDDFVSDLTEERDEFVESSKCTLNIEKLLEEQFPYLADGESKLHAMLGESFEYGAQKMYKAGKELGKIDLQFEEDYKSWREWVRRHGIKVGTGAVGVFGAGYIIYSTFVRDQGLTPEKKAKNALRRSKRVANIVKGLYQGDFNKVWNNVLDAKASIIQDDVTDLLKKQKKADDNKKRRSKVKNQFNENKKHKRRNSFS